MKFKVGDKVILKSLAKVLNSSIIQLVKPNGVLVLESDIEITRGMQKHFGRFAEITIIDGDAFNIKDSIYWFSEDWIEAVIPNNSMRYAKENEQGNICSKESEFLFIARQRKYKAQIRSFIEENKGESEEESLWVIGFIDGNIYLVYSEVVFSEFRFANEALANECLRLIGKHNYVEYILGA